MIAIVPDPVQTHLALRFDRAIDAIELAAGSMGFVIDRYWLPWDLEPKSNWADYDSFKDAKKDREQKETQPGLLMFRWDAKPEGAKPTLLYVFLVGETSTAGVNGDQFANAVNYADLLNGDLPHFASRQPCPPYLSSRGKATSTYVLGPTSSASLGWLSEWIERNEPKTLVIKTTARNPSEIQAGTRKQFSFFVRRISDATRELDSMLEAQDAIDKRLCKEINGHQIAILSETSTSLGASVESGSCADIFRYPREIASLRNAYGPSSAQNLASGDKTAGRRPSLSANLSDTTNRGDEPPDFSKAQSPLSQEATLMAFAAEMQRKHYRYIGINASNPLDVVFLVSFLRSAVPNARLFSFDSDLLLQHEPDNVPYIGAMSVATYPLLYRPLNQVGEVDPLGRMRLPFTSQREEGIYNATVCTVREMLNDYSLGHLSEREDCSSDPPLWLTVFGAGGQWPVEVLGRAEAPAPALESLRLPSSWKAVCILLCLLAILHVWVLFGLAPFSAKFQPFRLSIVAPGRQLLGIHMASATLALALALVTLSAWKSGGWKCYPWFFILILPLTCWFLTIKYFHWWRGDRSKPLKESRLLTPPPEIKPLSGLKFWSWIGGFLLVWAGAFIFGSLWSALLTARDGDGHYGCFFSFRAVHMASLVSPLTPMLPLLAATYIAAIFYVWHLLFNDRIRPRLNPRWEKSSGENKLRPGWRSEGFIAEAVNEDFLNAIIGAAILGAWFIVFFRSQFALFERLEFMWLYRILFCSVILLILVSGFRLALIWQKLRRFLLELNRQRARNVFKQLKSDGWASIWFYGSEDPDWDCMVRSLEVLQELWHTPDKPAAADEVDKAVREIRRTRRLLQDDAPLVDLKRFRVSETDGKLEKAISRAQDVLAEALNQALDSLQKIWGDPDSADRIINPSADRVIKRRKLLEKYVALRWVAFIRSVIARIRLLILFLAVAFSLALTSLVIYSFEPHQELLWAVTALFIGIGVLVVTVLIQMHINPILVSIAGTESGKLDLKFYVHLVALGIGPFLTLLATHFPSFGRYVLNFVQPGLEALK